VNGPPSASSRFAASRSGPAAARKDPERRFQVDIEHRVELLVAHLLDQAVPSVAGVVDDDVDAPKVSIAVWTKRLPKSAAVTSPAQTATSTPRPRKASAASFAGASSTSLMTSRAPSPASFSATRASDAARRSGQQRHFPLQLQRFSPTVRRGSSTLGIGAGASP